MIITFPSQYEGRLGAAPCTINILNFFDGNIINPTCSFSNLDVIISGIFTTGNTYPSGSLLWMYIGGIRNPRTTKQTDPFTLSIDVGSDPHTASADGITCNAGVMTCSLKTDPASVNQKGKLTV